MEDSGGRVRSSTHTKRQREEHTSKGLVSSTTGSRHCTRVRRQQPRENREETPDTLQEKKKKNSTKVVAKAAAQRTHTSTGKQEAWFGISFMQPRQTQATKGRGKKYRLDKQKTAFITFCWVSPYGIL